MKLRIRGDSLRLRLTKSEVQKIAQGEFVKETTRFLDGIHLHYVLSPDNELQNIEAHFSDCQITVGVPMKIAQDWAKSEKISLKNQEGEFSILVEKDFTCLKGREHEREDESDMFFNPNSTKGHCT